MVAAASHTLSTSLAASYVSPSPVDELLGPGGAVQPHWHPILEGLERLSHAERLDRMERINTRVRETGIAHDLFADPSRNLQPWRLDLVPLAIPAETWTAIETAVIQRARLFEALLADLYGPQTLLRRGIVPPGMIFNDPTFLRPCHGLSAGARRIQFFSTDIARGADGQWRVVDSHVETPAGIGYALANRTVMTQVSGDIFAASNAARLAPFFQNMQDALAARVGRPDGAVALLTPGPHHNDFFSHAYLARYLGFLLVEGADLRAEKDRVFLKTLDGLRPVDLLVRSVSGAYADALELEPSGFLGPVGLLQVVRQKPDLMANALGSAIAENRGLGSYLPAVCKALLGEALAMWNAPTWWLGESNVRGHVIENLNAYVIRHASEQTARPGKAAAARDPAKLTIDERARLIAEIQRDGEMLIAEEKTVPSTAPAYGPYGLEAKPFAVRVFATAVPGGYQVMPGGLAMTVNPDESMALTATDGASRDVWVVGETAPPAFRSLWRPTIEGAAIQRSPRDLPSRVADNLFWLGRYTERADGVLRLIRNCLSRIEEDSGPRQNLRLARAVLINLLERDAAPAVKIPDGLDDARTVAFLARALLTAPDRIYGLPQTLGHVHRIAGLSRDRLSLEAWRTLNAFYGGRQWQQSSKPMSIAEELDLIDAGLGALSAFNGLTHENMTRNFGWSFLDMGRRIARAHNLAQLLRAAFATAQTSDDDSTGLLFLLELVDSFITYRSRYRLNPAAAPVLDLLLLDETNPRSLAFQLAALVAHIDTLPQTGKGGGRSDVQRVALTMLNEVRLSDAGRLADVDGKGQRAMLIALLDSIIAQVPVLSEMLTRRYFSVIETAPKWARARSRVSA